MAMLLTAAANGLARRSQIILQTQRCLILPLGLKDSEGWSAKLPTTALTTAATATTLLMQVRSFAKAAAAEKKKPDAASYWDQKKAAKDKRRDIYVSRQERKDRLKVRRAGRPNDQKKIDFRHFFIKKKVNDEYMDRKARQVGMSWKIQVAVLLERIHVVLPDKEVWELEYEKMKAHMNMYGKVYPKELVGDIDYDAVRPMTDEEVLAHLPFTPAPRETEADASGDVRTTDRKLKTNIYLTVQQDSDQWQFPTVDLNEDETLIAAAKRALPEKVGSEVEFWCPSNCPWTVDLAAFPEEQQKSSGVYGTKTFFIKVQHDEGNVSKKDMTVKDFAWLDRGEIVELVKQQQGDYMSKFYYYML